LITRNGISCLSNGLEGPMSVEPTENRDSWRGEAGLGAGVGTGVGVEPVTGTGAEPAFNCCADLMLDLRRTRSSRNTLPSSGEGMAMRGDRGPVV
jgi:hypothetical protein